MANQVVPLYLSEMAPFKYRGGLNMMFQLAVTIGGWWYWVVWLSCQSGWVFQLAVTISGYSEWGVSAGSHSWWVTRS
jgi:hypothetical protein